MKIAIVDDHKLILQALHTQIQDIEGVTAVSSFDNPEKFMESLLYESFDLVFLDINLADTNGFDILARIRAKNQALKVFMLSANISQYTLRKAIDMGANGFVGKDAELGELSEAISSAGDDEFYVGRTLMKYARELLKAKKSSYNLSEREIEIVQLITEGLSYKEIAEKLFISPRTVEAHRNHILEKLNLKNVTELVRFALKNHLI
jgi:DNA-binding NarL/FixJ family response regulator